MIFDSKNAVKMSPERDEFAGRPDQTTDKNMMTTQDIPNVVPACPPGLAFQREDFLHENFTVDSFLSRTMSSGNEVGLERLRDDLGVYLKVRNILITEKFVLGEILVLL